MSEEQKRNLSLPTYIPPGDLNDELRERTLVAAVATARKRGERRTFGMMRQLALRTCSGFVRPLPLVAGVTTGARVQLLVD